jgi:hypothetical protein
MVQVMATRTQTITLDAADIKAAIQYWLEGTCGTKAYVITLSHMNVYDDSPIYSAKAVHTEDL